MDDVNLFPQYNTKTDLSEERRKEGKSVKNVLYNFHCSFRGNNKNFRFMSPLKGTVSFKQREMMWFKKL